MSEKRSFQNLTEGNSSHQDLALLPRWVQPLKHYIPMEYFSINAYYLTSNFQNKIVKLL
jgi:hypothetical protein